MSIHVSLPIEVIKRSLIMDRKLTPGDLAMTPNNVGVPKENQ